MFDLVHSLHFINMILVLASSTITGIWGLVLYFQMKPAIAIQGEAVSLPSEVITEGKEEVVAQPQEAAIDKPWSIALIVTLAFSLFQALLGIIMVLMGYRPGTGTGLYYLHYVYGAIVALAIPVAYTYTSKKLRTTVLILSIAALIIAAAGARGMMTGLGIGS